jgi:uncharacterized protein YcbX
MTVSPQARVCALYRYPVKGLSGEAVAGTELEVGRPMAHDRRFAIAHGTTIHDPASPDWLPRNHFVGLAGHERLAQLRSVFDPERGTLELSRGGKTLTRGQITAALGRTIVDQFLTAFLGAETRGRPRLVEGPVTGLADCREPLISLVSLSSVADLARVAGGKLNPLRFRANVYFDGLPPWSEFGWVGRDVRLGQAVLRIVDRIERCAAIDVDPETGNRDLNLQRDLDRGFGHRDVGVYAAVIDAGSVAVGDGVFVSGEERSAA